MKQPAATGIPLAQSYAPQVAPPQALARGQTLEFSTELCDCFSDCSLCCMTLWCPCITFGRIAEIVDRGSTSCGMSGALYALLMAMMGFQWVYSCTYRSKLRALYGMQENCCGDCCVHCCCGLCALTQEYRELQLHGYNMPLGWHGNMEKQIPGMMPPPITGGMTR